MTITQCPKCGYQRQDSDRNVNALICPACGIVYHKWIERHQPENSPLKPNASFIIKPHPSWISGIVDTLVYVPDETDPIVLAGRVLTWVALFIWGCFFISTGIKWVVINNSFMHNINLPFHEFGHVLFMPFGDFMHILGGSLFQILLPLGLMAAFLVQRQDTFAASVMLWWAGQSLVDLAPYIADAQDRLMPLVGGGDEDSHDWGNLLTMMNLLDKTHTLARFDFGLGSALMLLASAWGAYVLYRQFNR